MAWYDYLGGIGQGIEQASRTGLAAVKERLQEEAGQVEQELARLDPTQPLTADQVKRYGKYVGAGSFTRTPEGQFLLKQTPQQETTRRQLEQERITSANKQKFETMMGTPEGRAKWNKMDPESQVYTLRGIGVQNPLESGMMSPEAVSAMADRTLKSVMQQQSELARATREKDLLERRLEMMQAQGAQREAIAQQRIAIAEAQLGINKTLADIKAAQQDNPLLMKAAEIQMAEMRAGLPNPRKVDTILAELQRAAGQTPTAGAASPQTVKVGKYTVSY